MFACYLFSLVLSSSNNNDQISVIDYNHLSLIIGLPNPCLSLVCFDWLYRYPPGFLMSLNLNARTNCHTMEGLNLNARTNCDTTEDAAMALLWAQTVSRNLRDVFAAQFSIWPHI
jgi:hypothetical protein